MFDIIGKRNIFFLFSGALVVASIALLFIYGLKPGIDFTGGTLIEIRFEKDRPHLEEMHAILRPLSLGSVLVQPANEQEFILKTRFVTEEEHQKILDSVRAAFEKEDNKVLEERIETIGPTISSHLRQRSFSVTIAVLVTIGLYIAFAFRRVSRPIKSWKYGVSAIVALAHDVLITLGVFAVLGRFYDIEVDIPFVVAVLTIAGYSVNDTIVVFDRVRENLIKYGSDNFESIVNRGLNETMVRSLNTSLATLLVSLALFFFGGETIHYFSLALIVGIISGTYSSIFVASALLVAWEEWSRKRRA